MSHISNIRCLRWCELLPELEQREPELARLLVQLQPDETYRFILASYPYGMNMVEQGEFRLPLNDQEAVSINDPRMAEFSDDLTAYAKMPLGLVLNKTMELYYETNNRVICDKLLPTGSVVGAWEFFDKKLHVDTSRQVNISAGARSLFLLPLISDQVSHLRLKKAFNISATPPTKLTEHSKLFAELSRQLRTDWHCEVLFFCKEWFTPSDNPNWKQFENALYQIAWRQSHSARRQLENTISWERTLYNLSERNNYLPPRIIAQLKHVFLLSEGIFPGMVFSSGNTEELAPLPGLRDIYSEVYRLKNKAPLFMHPAYISDQQPVYYSLNYPGNLENFLPSKRVPRLMDELRIIMTTLDSLNAGLFDRMPNLQPFTVEAFHPAANGDDVICDLQQLVEQDKVLVDYFNQHDGEFSLKNAFLKGCIKLHQTG